ncbi:MAG: DUF7594 domain-containing protein, partial [Luteolibacter sp.]
GSTRFNTVELRIENQPTRKRIVYLQFVVPPSSPVPTTARLSVTEGTDISSGVMTIRAFAGLTNNWTETNLTTSNAPAKGASLSSFTGNILDGTTVSFDVRSFVNGPGIYSFVLEANASPLDVSFVSKEGSPGPRLELTYGTAAAAVSNFASQTAGFGDISATADDNNDGITNFQAYAFGIDPADASTSGRIVPKFDKATGTLTYHRRSPALTGLSYTVCSSTTLAKSSWNPLVKDTDYTESISTADGIETVTIKLVSPPTAPALFLQIIAN